MIEFFQQFHPVVQALLATCFTWFLTALGASGVFFAKDINKKVLDAMLGFAAGVISLQVFGLARSGQSRCPRGRISRSGFRPQPGFFLAVVFEDDRQSAPSFASGLPDGRGRGGEQTGSEARCLLLAITLHNIPEGLAVGVAFGAVAAGIPSATLPGAIALAVGIGIQNFPEGLAVSQVVVVKGCPV